MCPDNIGDEALLDYADRLEFGTVFSRNSFGESLTIIAEASDQIISVLCRMSGNPIKEWAVTKVTIEDGKFVHQSVSTYFTLQGALKEHCALLGVPFEESIDDYS
jgi:hypothetical protein